MSYSELEEFLEIKCFNSISIESSYNIEEFDINIEKALNNFFNKNIRTDFQEIAFDEYSKRFIKKEKTNFIEEQKEYTNYKKARNDFHSFFFNWIRLLTEKIVQTPSTEEVMTNY